MNIILNLTDAEGDALFEVLGDQIECGFESLRDAFLCGEADEAEMREGAEWLALLSGLRSRLQTPPQPTQDAAGWLALVKEA